MESKYESRVTSHSAGRLTAESRIRAGSALILVVVLTSLLAIVGVMFVMVARVDRIATSAISENKELNSAVETVIAKISQELVLDVPGMPKGREDYYDYPDANNAWLASLEPYEKTAGNYYWRRISDVTGFLADNNYDIDDVGVDPPGPRKYIQEYPEITLDTSGELDELWADADGDGIADSKWVELDDISSNKGKPIYAAIRIIDNGGMLNVNTARQFNPNSAVKNEIDGSSQTQIDLLALSDRGSTPSPLDELDEERFGDELHHDMDRYLRDVVWRYNEPNGRYTPFDISDELELRYRFMLNEEDIDTRIEEVWDHAFQWPNADVPIGTGSLNLDDWFGKVQYDWSEPNAPNDYSYRHIGTTYNMDRIINPYGGKMVNVNRDDAGLIYNAIKLALFTADPNFKDIDEIAAQTAVNLIDFRDNDSNVTVFDPPPPGGKRYYGFERPCIYISELVHRFVKLIPPGGPIGPGGEVEPVIYRSYAIELYKPYLEDSDPNANDWKLVIGESPGGPIGAPVFGAKEYDIEWSDGKDFHVILFQDLDPEKQLTVDSAASVQEPDFVRYSEIFEGGDLIELQRRVRANDGRYIWVTVDSNLVPDANANNSAWLNPNANPISRSVRRDITLHKCIRRLWSVPLSGSTLGGDNNYTDPDPNTIQAHPENEPFTNVGEIGMVFHKGAYYRDRRNRADRIGYSPNKDEEQVRLDLADPNFQQIFRYLTVFDPAEHGSFLTETRIKGRININTAPWYVIAQLPWMTDKIAQAIVAYRDKLDMDPNGPDYNHVNANDSRYQETGIRGLRESDGFESIGELATVVNDKNEDDYSMRYYTLGAEKDENLDEFPDLTPRDGARLGSTEYAIDDFEERDVIFARISNLVTVRSDVFTAYILVRIGADGPQRRVMAILDRSNVYSGDGRVQIVALHAVADPR